MDPAADSTLDCPQCGGANSLPSGQSLLHCQYCDTALFVDRAGLVSHYEIPRLLDADGARAAARRWMAGNDTVKGLDRNAQELSLEPISFPVWLFRVAAQRGDRSGGTVRTEPAAATPIGQLADLDIPAGELRPYPGEREGVSVTSPTVPLETARAWLGEAAGRVRESSLVHLPLWDLRYRYQDESYRALVDGSTGAVLANRFPAKAEAPFRLTLGLCLLLFGGLGLWVSNPLAKLVVFGLVALPLLALAHRVTSRT